MMLGENPGKCRAGFLSPVFMVRSNKDDMLPFAGAFLTFVSDLGSKWKHGEEKENESHRIWDKDTGVEWLSFHE
jgi:hypothetical protein